MFTIILTVSALICFAAIHFTYLAQTRYSKQKKMLFAVTIPEHAASHPALLSVTSRFLKRHNRTALLMLAAFFPIFLLIKHPSYQVIYFFIWIASFIPAMAAPFRDAFRSTLALKRENDWFIGEKRVVFGDVRVAVLKNAKAAPPSYFLLPAALSAAVIMWAHSISPEHYWITYGGAGATILFFLITLGILRGKTIVYSANTETNLALNQARRRNFSYSWLGVACIEVLFFGALFQFIVADQANQGLYLTAVVLLALIPAGLLLTVYTRSQRLEKELLASDNQRIYTDEDEYWENGFTYHNPADHRLVVPKRVGVGETINTGTTAGKIIAGSVLALFAGTILLVSFMLIRSELSMPTLTVDENRQIHISYPMYGYSFHSADIEDLALIDTVPSGVRINGESTSQYARGHFRLEELGRARLYIIKNNPPYIQLKLKDGYIFYNEEQPEQTRERFEEIKASQ